MVHVRTLSIRVSVLDDGSLWATVDGDGGQEDNEIALPDDQAFSALLHKLAILRMQEADITAIGQRLFDALLPGPLRRVYDGSLGKLEDDARLRLQLTFPSEAGTFAHMPWEYLYDPVNGPLALRGISIVRMLAQASSPPAITITPPLRVLLTAAQTDPPVNVRRELSAVETALARLDDQVVVHRESRLTLAKLRKRLREGYHVWHYVGHGGEGQLFLEDSDDDADPVEAQVLAATLAESGVRLVVLSACQGATVTQQMLHSVAPALVAAGIPAVVAMQFSVTEESSQTFAVEFYRALISGWPIDVCVTEGRKALLDLGNGTSVDWGIPVVYSRAEDGVLFTHATAPTEAPPAEQVALAAPAPRRPVQKPPAPPTPLLGRDQELAAIRARLGDRACRLVTLTGPGGVGKTHLGLVVAQRCDALFKDGVAFVSLTEISDPELVCPTIASAVGVQQSPDEALLASLIRALDEKDLLLVLDNFEQVVGASSYIAQLLANTSRLKILVTSRAALHLRAEFEVAVQPLAVPAAPATAAAVSQYPAIELFVQRAQAIEPDFHLDDASARLVVEICTRVDGLPLAIELAAARIKILSLQQLVHRLSRRLDVLSIAKHDLPRRHQVLRNTVDWSYGLLSSEHQQLFARMAVFVGGSTLDAAEVVCQHAAEPPVDVLEAVQHLVDNSLVRRVTSEDGMPHFSMLETIRDYAIERLHASGEIETVRARHAAYFLDFAELAMPELAGGSSQAVWFARVDADLDNIRAALRWAIEQSHAATALRIAVALREFWMTRSYLNEGRQWLESALAEADRSTHTIPAELRSKALTTAGWLAANSRDYAAAELLFEQSLAWARETEQPAQIMGALGDLAQAARMQQDLQRATLLYQEALAICRAIGDRRALAWMLCNLGIVAHTEMDDERAALLLEEGAEWAHQVNDTICVAWCQTFLARIAKDRAEYGRSAVLFAAVLALFQDVGHGDGIAFTLEGRAGLAIRQGHLETAARLFGAAEALRETINRPEVVYVRDLDPASVETTSAAWRAAWAEGRTLLPEQAVAYALAIAT